MGTTGLLEPSRLGYCVDADREVLVGSLLWAAASPSGGVCDVLLAKELQNVVIFSNIYNLPHLVLSDAVEVDHSGWS